MFVAVAVGQDQPSDPGEIECLVAEHGEDDAAAGVVGNDRHVVQGELLDEVGNPARGRCRAHVGIAGQLVLRAQRPGRGNAPEPIAQPRSEVIPQRSGDVDTGHEQQHGALADVGVGDRSTVDCAGLHVRSLRCQARSKPERAEDIQPVCPPPYGRRSVAVYEQLAKIDPGHDGEALYWAQRERVHAKGIEARMRVLGSGK